jgi:hypothetical protein
MSKLLPVTKEVNDYSSEELIGFREQFIPVREKLHRLRRYFVLICTPAFLVFISDLAVMMIYQKDLPDRIMDLLGYIFIFVLLIIFTCCTFMMIFSYRIKCPACHNRLDFCKLGGYCPECGSDQLEAGKWLKFPCCNACSKRLSHGKGGRGYIIRVCTHCGVFLDEKGF